MNASALTATVSHTTTVDRWGDTLNHYVIRLSNGITAKRQAVARKNCPQGANAVAFHLENPRKTTASANLKGLLRKFKGEPGVVVVDLQTSAVTVCG